MDIEKLRADTPGVADLIHFNNCGAGLMPDPVLRTVTGYLEEETRLGGYETAEKHQAEIDGFYDVAARHFNCAPGEIAFMENATMAWVGAFYGLRFKPGDVVITAEAEYASNYIAYLQLAKKRGIEIQVAPSDDSGQINLEALAQMVDGRTRLISVTHVPTNGGLVNPAAEIGRIARKHGVPYLLDACQSFGQMPLDVEEIGCDMLSVTGRKFMRGPRGTGLLYIRKSMLEKTEPPYLDLHSAEWIGTDSYRLRPDAKRFENWENYLAGKLGLKHAMQYALDIGLEVIEERVTALANRFRTGIEAIAGGTVRDLGQRRCGIVSFTIDGVDPAEAKAQLQKKKINVSTTRVTSTRLDMERRKIPVMQRVGIHYYNTEDEVDAVLDAFAQLAKA